MREILLVCLLVCCVAVGAFAGDSDVTPKPVEPRNPTQQQETVVDIPAYTLPDVQNAMADIYASQWYGKRRSESSFVIHGHRPDFAPIIRPIHEGPPESHRDRFAVITGDTAIVHTHPDEYDPRPSQNDMALATKYGLDMYTVTSRGVFLYRQGMKEPVRVIDRDTFRNIVKERKKEKASSRHRATSLVTTHDPK